MSSIDAYDLYPRKLPDLFKGTQLVVMGRYRKPGDAKVVLTGYVNGEKRTFDYGTTAPRVDTTDDFIPRLWAIRKVGFLLEEIRLRGEKPELKDEVLALGKKFGIVTPYTSFLVVEDEPVVSTRPEPRPVDPWHGQPPPAMERAPSGPSRDAEGEEDSFDRLFGSAPSKPKSGGGGAYAPAPAAAPAESMAQAEGKSGVAVSRATKKMKEQERGPSGNEPVRVAAGRTFIFRDGGWIDSEGMTNPGKQLKVKFLSKAYFSLLQVKPELKAAFALGERVLVMVAPGKSIVVGPQGEETRTRCKPS